MVLRKYAIAICAPMLVLVLVVHMQARAVNTRYELENLKGELSELGLQKESFEGVIAGLKSPDWLLCRAQERGMVFELAVVNAPRLAMGGDDSRVLDR